MTESAYLERLPLHEQVESEVIQAIAAWLCAGQPLHVLDAGCGKGAPALVFAEAGCTVVGVDMNADEAEAARGLLAATPFADRVDFGEGDVRHLDFADAAFDLVWASRVLHHVADKLAAVRELKRVLKPGGRLAIREGGLPLQMLPFDLGIGEPGLQDRLHVADNRWFARMLQTTLPDEVPYPYGWSQLLVDAGFQDVTARTFMLEFLPPLDQAKAEFVLRALRRAFKSEEYEPVLSDDDRAVVQTLLDPASPHYVLKRTDLHVRYGVSVYVGTRS